MILALDLATNTGWCAGVGDSVPHVGHVKMPDTKEEIGPFGHFFEEWLIAKLEEYDPTMVVFESPMLPKATWDSATQRMKQAPTNLATTRKLQGLAYAAEVVVYRRRRAQLEAGHLTPVDCREVFLQTVKKELGGSGTAGKPDMMAAAKRCGIPVKTFDEADAFGVWLVGVRHYAKAYQQIWDQKLWGGRGRLQL